MLWETMYVWRASINMCIKKCYLKRGFNEYLSVISEINIGIDPPLVAYLAMYIIFASDTTGCVVQRKKHFLCLLF